MFNYNNIRYSWRINKSRRARWRNYFRLIDRVISCAHNNKVVIRHCLKRGEKKERKKKGGAFIKFARRKKQPMFDHKWAFCHIQRERETKVYYRDILLRGPFSLFLLSTLFTSTSCKVQLPPASVTTCIIVRIQKTTLPFPPFFIFFFYSFHQMGESRTELLAWVNDLLQVNYTKVEQAGTGNITVSDTVVRC